MKVLTKDSVTVSVDAVVYYRVSNATVSPRLLHNIHEHLGFKINMHIFPKLSRLVSQMLRMLTTALNFLHKQL